MVNIITIVLTKWVKDSARGKLDFDNGWPARLSRKGRLQLAPAVLGLNFLTVAKQIVGFLSGIEMAGKSATFEGIAQSLASLY